MYWHDGMGFGWWGFGLGMLLFWGILIAGIVLLVRWAVSSSARNDAGTREAAGWGARQDADGARRILDERFARGEIDEEEYRRRRDVLRGA